jgi:hypothetical protein
VICSNYPTVRKYENSFKYEKGQLAQLEVLKGLLNVNDYHRRQHDIQQKLYAYRRILEILRVRYPDD